MKWIRPKVMTYGEKALLAKLAAKAQTHRDSFNDTHQDGGG